MDFLWDLILNSDKQPHNCTMFYIFHGKTYYFDWAMASIAILVPEGKMICVSSIRYWGKPARVTKKNLVFTSVGKNMVLSPRKMAGS